MNRLEAWMVRRLQASSSVDPLSGLRRKNFGLIVYQTNGDVAGEIIAFTSNSVRLLRNELTGSSEVEVPTSDIDPRYILILKRRGDLLPTAGLWRFIALTFTPLGWTLDAFRRLNQWLFNKQSINMSLQKEALGYLQQHTEVRPASSGLSAEDIAVRRFGRRVLFHPHQAYLTRRIQLYLMEFETNAWVIQDKKTLNYKITPAGAAEYERRGEESRRHRSSTRLQLSIFWIGAVSAMSAVVQAGFIKVPPLIDLTSPTPHAASSAPGTPYCVPCSPSIPSVPPAAGSRASGSSAQPTYSSGASSAVQSTGASSSQR